VFKEITEDDDAYFYLMAPYYEAKDAFAAWVTDPARLTTDNFTAFQVVLSRLKDLLAGRDGSGIANGQRRVASGGS